MREPLAETDLQAFTVRFHVCGLDDVWASIIIAAILLLCISAFVRRVDESGDRDMKKIWVLVGLQYACFLGGLLCFALNMTRFWLGAFD